MTLVIEKVGSYHTCKVLLYQPVIEYEFDLEITVSPPLSFSVRVKVVEKWFSDLSSNRDSFLKDNLLILQYRIK